MRHPHHWLLSSLAALSLLSLGALAQVPSSTTGNIAAPALSANSLTLVERSAFSSASFAIGGDGYQMSDFAAAGQRDALRGHRAPPSVLVVCFRNLIRDPLREFSELGQESCREWRQVSWLVDNTGQGGMSLTYTRKGYSGDITGVILFVPDQADYYRWNDVAKKAWSRYEDAFVMQRRDIERDEERRLRRDTERKEMLQKLREKPIMVYPE